MSTPDSSLDLAAIGRRLGLAQAERFVETELKPLIESVPVEPTSKKGAAKSRLQLPLTLGMIGFAISFFSLFSFLPDNFFGGLITFVLFLPLFAFWMIVMVYLFRDRFFAAFVNGKERYLARSKALARLAEELGLIYVPSPGGAPAVLKEVAKHQIAPDILRQVVDVLDDHGGMDEPLAVVRRSGTMITTTVIGSKEQREKYNKQAAENVQVEDGFRGDRGGVPFSAFEWVESVEDAADIYHLALVFQVPYRLHGVTQLRTRKTGWPKGQTGADFSDVDIVAKAFRDRFRMRSTDQTEARTIFDPAVVERVAELAHGEKVQAVAFEEHLVIDVEGEDRFGMVNLHTGAWSRDTIAQSMLHVAELLELAQAVAEAFRLRR